MIKVITKYKHKDKCDSCPNSVDLKTIVWATNPNQSSSMTLCADCRYTLAQQINRTFDKDFTNCSGCGRRTHLDDLSSCNTCGDHDNNEEWFCSSCLDEDECIECIKGGLNG